MIFLIPLRSLRWLDQKPEFWNFVLIIFLIRLHNTFFYKYILTNLLLHGACCSVRCRSKRKMNMAQELILSILKKLGKLRGTEFYNVHTNAAHCYNWLTDVPWLSVAAEKGSIRVPRQYIYTHVHYRPPCHAFAPLFHSFCRHACMYMFNTSSFGASLLIQIEGCYVHVCLWVTSDLEIEILG